MLNLVLYQPDMPGNLGTILRLGACLGATIHVIEPCGFPLDDQRLRRAGMDYIDHVTLHRHMNWEAFLAHRAGEASRLHEPSAREAALHGEGSSPSRRQTTAAGKLLLLETDGTTRYTDVTYNPTDYIVLGSESHGTPRSLYAQMDATITIPMCAPMRSLNVAMSAGLLLGEACRQMDWKLK